MHSVFIDYIDGGKSGKKLAIQPVRVVRAKASYPIYRNQELPGYASPETISTLHLGMAAKNFLP
jgi:hypothetical protein